MKQANGWMVGILAAVLVAAGSGCASTGGDTPQATDAPDALSTEETAEETSQGSAEGGDAAPTTDTAAAPKVEAPDPALTDFPHRRIEVIDKVDASSEFAEFRDRLAEAVETRDRGFIMSLMPEGGLVYGFGGPMRPDDLELLDENGWFWQELDKMVAPNSCEISDYSATDAENTAWVCPNISASFYRQYPPENTVNEEGLEVEFSTVIVYGRNVNVRAAPNAEAQIVGRLSNELVTIDNEGMQRVYDQSPEGIGAVDGWTAVILPNQVQGYVYNRYVYQPLSPRAIFENIDGQWQIIRVLAGD